MKRTLFLLNHRSGSHFMEAMLRGVVDDIHRPGTFQYKYVLPSPVWMKTDPPEQCLFYGVNNPERDIASIITDPKENQVHEAYSMHAYTSETPAFIRSLPPADWTFFFIYRDPRNKMESLLRRAAKFPESLPREKLFPDWVNISKLIVRQVVELLPDPRFHLIDFDLLFDDPLKGLNSMCRSASIELDMMLYPSLVAEWNRRHNSSYADMGGSRRERWLVWTSEERELFRSTLGDELIELGYETDNSWVDR